MSDVHVSCQSVNMIYVDPMCSTRMMESIGTRLREARLKAGFSSARSAATRFGWTPSTYAAHENGQNEFGTEVAAKYASAFKVDLVWLYIGDAYYRTERFVPIIGTAYAPDHINYKVPVSQILIDPLTASRKSIIAIARTGLCQVKDLVAFQVCTDHMRPRFADGTLICLLMGDENYEDEDLFCHLEDDRTHLCYAIAMKRDQEGNYIGDIVDSQGVVRKQVRPSRVWTIMLIVPARGWSHYAPDQPGWEKALSAIRLAD